DHAVVPGAGRILGGEQDVPAPGAHHVGDHEVEAAVVVADRRRPHPAPGGHAGHADLALSHRDMADELEAAQIAGAEDRDPGQVLEAPGRPVVPLADAADARIGMESGDQRIGQAAVLGHGAPVHGAVEGWVRCATPGSRAWPYLVVTRVTSL